MERKPLMYEVSHTSKFFKEKVKQIAYNCGVNPRYFLVLKYLAKNIENIVSQQDICEFLQIKPSSVSVTIQMMEKEGLINKHKSLNDNRKVVISLTSLGQEKYNIITKAYKNVEDVISSNLTNDEIDMLYNYMDKINELLGAI